jgi:hypothetical protein
LNLPRLKPLLTSQRQRNLQIDLKTLPKETRWNLGDASEGRAYESVGTLSGVTADGKRRTERVLVEDNAALGLAAVGECVSDFNG